MREHDVELINAGYKKYFSSYNDLLIENTYSKNKLYELFQKKALLFSDDKIYEKNFNASIRIKSQLVNKRYKAIINNKVYNNYSLNLTSTGAST